MSAGRSSTITKAQARYASWVTDVLVYIVVLNLFIIQRTKIRTEDKLPAGKTTIEVETTYIEPRPGGPLKITLKVNGNTAAEGTVPISAPLLFTANDCLDIGIAHGSPVSLDYHDKAPFPFTGTIEQIRVQYLNAP